jgi:hypothetical protein
MAGALDEKIKQTQSSFPALPTGAVAPCPAKKAAPGAAPARSPVEVKTDFALTQQIMQTLSGGGPAAAPAEQKAKEKKAWIEIILVDAEGQPMPGVRYRITPPGGKPREGRLNEHGQAGLYEIDPGNCKITFPDLDKDAWE